jgi:two-component system, OmpR family, sensor histidine kinase KdpD
VTRPLLYGCAALAIALVTGVGLLAFGTLALADVTMLYLIAIMVASFAGRGPAILASSLAVAAFDFCFVPPRFTFAVADASYLLTFAVMFGAGLVVSELTARMRGEQNEALRRERLTAALLAFTRDIATAHGTEDISAAAVRHLEDVLGVAAAALVPDEDDALSATAGLVPLAPQELTVARWAFEHAEPAGHGTATHPDARILALPLIVDGETVGVVVVQTRGGQRLERDHRRVLDAFLRQAALAIGRARLAEEAREAALRVRAEELRNALLSAVSHDMRTPLASITGAATTLRDTDAGRETARRARLLDTIVDEARRLERVLANVLSITRVESGLSPKREWVPVEELIGSALTRLEDVLGERAVTVDIEPDLAVPVDSVLFEQALINLLENALKHGEPPFDIAARAVDGDVIIEIGDSGAGLPRGQEQRVFEKFFRASRAPGVGLGLAVVRGIVEAHDGTVVASNRADGGAQFRICLPAASERPAVPAPDEIARSA